MTQIENVASRLLLSALLGMSVVMENLVVEPDDTADSAVHSNSADKTNNNWMPE